MCVSCPKLLRDQCHAIYLMFCCCCECLQEALRQILYERATKLETERRAEELRYEELDLDQRERRLSVETREFENEERYQKLMRSRLDLFAAGKRAGVDVSIGAVMKKRSKDTVEKERQPVLPVSAEKKRKMDMLQKEHDEKKRKQHDEKQNDDDEAGGSKGDEE